MKTIQFTGTEKHVEAIKKFHENTWNKTDTLQQSETRVYVIDTFNIGERNWKSLTDEEFITLAEEEGNIYTLEGFQEAFNSQDINTEIDVVRFINMPIFGEISRIYE